MAWRVRCVCVLQSFPCAVFVESAEGDSLGVITTKAQLDGLLSSLNRRGPREMLLHSVSKPICGVLVLEGVGVHVLRCFCE